MSASKTIQTVERSNYQPPAWWIENVALEFDLDPKQTRVTTRMTVRRNQDQPQDQLELHGEQLQLESVLIDGVEAGPGRSAVTDELLILTGLPEQCVIETTVVISPVTNKSLSGLYQTSGNYCTQCEAMGFRRITYFPDRPDVMATYQVTIRGDRTLCPVMLSNGNRVAARDLDDGRHEVVWEDPFPKPSYLFALVSGNLQCHRGTFTTLSGREVALEIWVEPQNIDKCEHALRSLQKSMKWDEEVFGLEYDLDIYMIVAVNDFNMGAMENKGLNVFNSKYVLALPETATDADYEHVEAVIAHEYFHNWTGNRVTCRDWFQLTLKEGLTVFRDQQFTADQTSADVKRIDDVAGLRSGQFLEDSGPMAHPIRPESYISMDNFYTATVYRKGAEIIRMYHTLLGADGFRRGMDLYFRRHDNSAVTCDDFRAAMGDANSVNFDLFDRWYSQAGTPELSVSEHWNPTAGEFRLSMKQHYPDLSGDIPGASDRQPVPIPVRVGLLETETGAELAEHAQVLLLESESETFTFSGLSKKPIASVLRCFSAPVRLRMQRSDAELAFLMAHDTDTFNRWDAGQTLATNRLLDLANDAAHGRTLKMSGEFCEAFGVVLKDRSLDESVKALAITLPRESVLGQEMDVIDPDAVHAAREFFRKSLAAEWRSELLSIYHDLTTDQAYSSDGESISRRRLKNVVLGYLATIDDPGIVALARQQFDAADNMTDKQAALSVLTDLPGPDRDEALQTFYDQYRNDPLVIDKWFAVQALSRRSDTIDVVTNLTTHPDFNVENPNRVRSLLGALTQNQHHFHQADGAGYRLLTGFVLRIDPVNPQLAARLVAALNSYRRFDPSRQLLMENELKRIAEHPGLSKDVHEIIHRALNF